MECGHFTEIHLEIQGEVANELAVEGKSASVRTSKCLVQLCVGSTGSSNQVCGVAMDPEVQKALDRAKKRCEKAASTSSVAAGGSEVEAPQERDRPTFDSRPTLIMGEPIPQLFAAFNFCCGKGGPRRRSVSWRLVHAYVVQTPCQEAR